MKMRTLTQFLLIATLAISAFADINSTATLATGATLNLDAGTTGTSGGDLQWNGTSLTPQGNATAFPAPLSGSSAFAALDQQTLAAFGLLYTKSPITGASVAANSIIAVHTNGGNYAKLLVTANSGGSITLQYTTYGATAGGGGGGTGGPTITKIQNNYGLIPQGMPNWGIAPGALFFIQGSGLANVTTDLLSSASPGLQTTVQNVSVKVTVGSTSVQCYIYYLSPTQLDAVLPGNTPPGAGTLTVTNNGQTSAAAQITVLSSAFGLLSYGGTLAAAYDANFVLLTTTNSANPNQAIVLWGSGVGSDPANDDHLYPQKQNNLTNIDMHAFVGGVEAPISYRGRSQFPGVDQIVLTIPANAPTGCYQSVVLVSGNIPSNSALIPIAASGKTCSDSNIPSGLQGISSKPNAKFGVVGIGQSIGTGASIAAFGAFQAYSNYVVGGANSTSSLGSCVVINSALASAATTTPLDAGPAISVTGPGGNLTLNQFSFGGQTLYTTLATIPASFIPSGGGTFTFDNASGGKDVGHFNAALSFPAAFTWSNQAQITAVNRGQGVNVTWTGGNGGTAVTISGGSASVGGISVSFYCQAPVAAGAFQVPAWVTLSMPPGAGSLSVGVQSPFTLFSASGLDFGTTSGTITASSNVTYN